MLLPATSIDTTEPEDPELHVTPPQVHSFTPQLQAVPVALEPTLKALLRSHIIEACVCAWDVSKIANKIIRNTIAFIA